MKILDVNLYPNFLNYIQLSSNDICGIIEKYELSFPQIKNERVEWRIAFPVFLTPFYKYIYYYKKILKQNEYYEYYLSENESFFNVNKFEIEIIEGLRARIYRTYPSLIRDLHFGLFVKENFAEAEVIYNRKLDIEEGIDLIIKYNSNLYAINLFTDTARAHYGRKKKENRHTRFTNVKYVDLPVNFKGSIKCGNFFLYEEPELSLIKKTIFQL
jgi:hypothetical protein